MSSKVMVRGFRASSVSVGIREKGRKDFSLIVSDLPARVAGVFTTNRFKAAPVTIDERRVNSGTARAIIANSGIANAGTGVQGERDALEISRVLADRLKVKKDEVLVASTGVIGERLPVDKMIAGIDDLVKALHEEGIVDAELGIMTTDRFPKIETRQFSLDGRDVTIVGIAKGAGMIEPNMATMLAFVMTDAAVEKAYLKRVFKDAVDCSFNIISVDGCMSTNDTALIMANGAAGNIELTELSEMKSLFENALGEVMIGLAKAIVRDGEGATKIISISVGGAVTEGEARTIAYAVARSSLVKTAFFGEDANWGRIISAIGASGIDIDPLAVEVSLDGIALFRKGSGVPENEDKLAAVMKEKEISLAILLGRGEASFLVHTSDLTLDYVKLNAHYRS